jgi:putative intracellular protease/amidase
VFDGYSDWEPSLLVAVLNKFTDFEVHTFSHDGKPVCSFGNIHVLPDHTFGEVSSEPVDLLVLPGGEAWEEGKNQIVRPLIENVLKEGNTVAGICAATIFLGQSGFLNTIKHTSNHISYLKQMAPDYQGEDWYVNKPAVSDGNIITANGTAIVEFAESVLNHFDLFRQNELENWFQYFRKVETASH